LVLSLWRTINGLVLGLLIGLTARFASRGDSAMATTLVIAGYYGFGNWGDEAALAVLIRPSARGSAPCSHRCALARSRATARLHGNSKRSTVGIFLKFAGRSRARRGFFSAQGACSKTPRARGSLLYYLGVVRLAQHYDLPTYLIGQGIGPLRSQRSERWVAKTLQRARLVLVRDRASYQWAEAHHARVLLGKIWHCWLT
jgi:polysaccharide pyruvyl transferase WcaK-like protein